MDHPLSRCAPSPSLASREGDDTLAAGRPLLGVPGLGHADLDASSKARIGASKTFQLLISKNPTSAP
ncbi:hypothetical protein FB549_3444 [Delftia sp. HK171]|nr:hypothetical protein FB549_3444 [Delftia sp. HK171]